MRTGCVCELLTTTNALPVSFSNSETMSGQPSFTHIERERMPPWPKALEAAVTGVEVHRLYKAIFRKDGRKVPQKTLFS